MNFLIAVVAMLPYLIRDHGLFSLGFDFSAEQIPFHMLMRDSIRSGNVLWNWNIDLGSNFIESFNFYNLGSPFTWLFFLFPSQLIPYVIPWMIAVKIGVAGVTSYMYICRYCSEKSAKIASVLYAFSGFQLINMVFFHFLDIAALFPLLLWAVDKTVEEHKFGYLTWAAAVNCLTNFVFFVGEVIFLGVYFVVKYILSEENSLKDPKKRSKVFGGAFCCLFEGVLAMLISGIIVLPTVSGLLNNQRAAAKILGQNWFSFSTRDFLVMLKTFLMPNDIMPRTSSVNFSDWGSNGAYFPLVGMIFVFAYCRREKNWIATLIKVCFVMLLFPVLNNAFMLFSAGVYHRWLYMLTLILALASAYGMDCVHKEDVRFGCILSFLGIAAFAAFLKIVKWDNNDTHLVYNGELLRTWIYIAVAGIFLTYLVVNLPEKYRNTLLLCGVALSAIVIFVITVQCYQKLNDNTGKDFRQTNGHFSENAVQYLTEVPYQLDKDVLPYRYDFDEGIGYTYYNFGMTQSLPSINSFNSTIHPSITDFYDSLQIGRSTMTKRAPDGCSQLLSAKYIIREIREGDEPALSFGDSWNRGLFVDENALPIGFVYHTYMTEGEFKQLDKGLKPAAMLKALVVRECDRATVDSKLTHFNADVDGEISVDKIPTYVGEHSEESSTQFSVSTTTIHSVLQSKGEGFAFFSVPFDKYWNATVDGEPVDILWVNGFMAVPVHDGINEIQFVYKYTPVKLGLILSVTGVCSFALLSLAIQRRKANDKRKR